MKDLKFGVPFLLVTYLFSFPFVNYVSAQSDVEKQNGVLMSHLQLSHSGAKGDIKKRMENMKAIGAGMKRIGVIVRGRNPFDGSIVAAASERIALNGRGAIGLFSKNSQGRFSRASPKIWADWEEFSRSMNAMVRAATVLAEAGRAGNEEAVKSGYRALGKTCAGCHRNFREKKKRYP